MKNAVLYTGTFDPFHLGHLWQLERTYRAHPFEKAVIAMISRLASKKLPFTVDICPIEYVQPDKLRAFVNTHLSNDRVIRTVGSDVIVEFAKDAQFNFNDALLLFHYAVVVRPLVGEKEVQQAIAALPPDIARRFSYQIVHVHTEEDFSATTIRQDPIAAFKKGYITKAQLALIQQEHLYSMGTISAAKEQK
jgi:cytidyltransferase-like protein